MEFQRQQTLLSYFWLYLDWVRTRLPPPWRHQHLCFSCFSVRASCPLISHCFPPRLLLFPLSREGSNDHVFNFPDTSSCWAEDCFAWPPKCHHLSDREPSAVYKPFRILKMLLRALKVINFVSSVSKPSRMLSAAWAAALISSCALWLVSSSPELGVIALLRRGNQAVRLLVRFPRFSLQRSSQCVCFTEPFLLGQQWLIRLHFLSYHGKKFFIANCISTSVEQTIQ